MKFWVCVTVFVHSVLFISGCSVVIDSDPTKEDLIFVRNFAKSLRSQSSSGTATNSTDELK